MNPLVPLVGMALAPPAAAAPPALADWLATYGDPVRPVAETDAARHADEPLMLFWMAVEASPLGVGPPLPGTLVANFDGAGNGAALVGFTFLAAASDPDVDALVSGLRSSGWIRSEQQVQREGGDFLDLAITTSDGLTGVVSRRLEAGATTPMEDRRPAPTVWMTVSASRP